MLKSFVALLLRLEAMLNASNRYMVKITRCKNQGLNNMWVVLEFDSLNNAPFFNIFQLQMLYFQYTK